MGPSAKSLLFEVKKRALSDTPRHSKETRELELHQNISITLAREVARQLSLRCRIVEDLPCLLIQCVQYAITQALAGKHMWKCLSLYKTANHAVSVKGQILHSVTRIISAHSDYKQEHILDPAAVINEA